MPALSQRELAAILPQAYPFLMLDSVEDYKEGERLTAVKNISADEWVFELKNTFTGSAGTRKTADADRLSFPDTLLIEAAAQAALVLYHVTKVRDSGNRRQYFIGKVNAEFIEPAQIGDTLTINVTAGKLMDTAGYADVEIEANAALLARIELFFGVK